MKKIFTILGISAAILTSAQIKINEVYGGGGNSGALLKNDFVELINNSSASATLTGGYLQYASTAGTFSAGNILALPATITLEPGQKYLIQLAAGATGTVDLPTPDFAPAGTAAPDKPLALSGTGGKIALTNSNVLVTSATDSNVVDFVGWNTANMYEGTGPAPATTNSTSISRTNGIDTNDNAADFTAGVPTPTNSTGQTVSLAVVDVNSVGLNLIKNTNVRNTIVFGAKTDIQIINMNGQVVKTASVSDNSTMDVSSLAKGMYIVTGEINGKRVSQKMIKN